MVAFFGTDKLLNLLCYRQKTVWCDHELGQLLTQTAQVGDLIVFAEISRMARSTLQVLEILECCMQRELLVKTAKTNFYLPTKLVHKQYLLVDENSV